MIEASRQAELIVYDDEALARYSFGDNHPFGPARFNAFYQRFVQQHLDQQVAHGKTKQATDEQILLFHTNEYLNHVKKHSVTGEGFLDCGDTPAFKGIYEAAATVVGTTLDAIDQIMNNHYQRAFVPIAGLHHARRDKAAGFCALNDCGVAIEYLRHQYQIKNAAYIDIDAHHGDGVFYSFESDPDLLFADIHEDGIYLYPGTGHMNETGSGEALGTKLNLPVAMNAGDAEFDKQWQKIETYLEQRNPEFILVQCGADSIAGDPITHLQFSENSHVKAVSRLKQIANQYCQGRLLAMGGGGYNLENIAKTWTAVVSALI